MDEVEEAQKLMKSGQSQQALERVNKALAANPQEPHARFLKGVILSQQGKQSEAIEIYGRLTQDYPNLPEPYATACENLGDVYAKLASQAYSKALQLDASNSAAQSKLSVARELVREPRSASRQ